MFEADPETHAVMMIGEIGGPQEAEAAEFIRDHMTKPVIAYIAGLTAPKGRQMGHAGAIISAFGESAAEKVEILREAGVARGAQSRRSSAPPSQSCCARGLTAPAPLFPRKRVSRASDALGPGSPLSRYCMYITR